MGMQQKLLGCVKGKGVPILYVRTYICEIYFSTYEHFAGIGYFASCELRAASCELRAASCELRVVSCELRAASCELRVASCELRAASCESLALL
jgi:hypothetical protein